jgi:zinc transport system permease protein
MPVEWMEQLVTAIAEATGGELFVVKGVLALLLVCTLCGMVGSMVVGNRMAFFSDAMAHCAFAGVALGFLSVALLAGQNHLGKGEVDRLATWLVPLVMVTFGGLVGAAMVYVREQTALAADTVIGVFFALAIGFGAMLFRILRDTTPFNPENFLFGSLIFVPESDLVFLLALVFIVGGLFAWRYNDLVFASFSPSLARTRQISLRINNYLFIILLALVVNLSLKAVGALLINALLVVPAAAASNVAANMRQMFWLTVGFCITAGLTGFYLSTAVKLDLGSGPVKFGPSGTIVVMCVFIFFLTALLGGLRRRSRS